MSISFGFGVRELEKLGFKVFGICGWKKLRDNRAAIKFKPVVFWKIVSAITQLIIFYHPESATRLFGVMDIE